MLPQRRYSVKKNSKDNIDFPKLETPSYNLQAYTEKFDC